MEKLKVNRLNYLEDFLEILEQNIIYCRVTQDDIIVEASDMFCKITQYSKDELQGEYYSSLKSSYSVKNLDNSEVEFRKKNNDLFWLEIKKIAQYDENNDFLCYLIIHQDITASKQVKSLNKSLELSILETANESMKVHHLNITLEKRVRKAIDKNKKQEQHLLEQSKLAIMGEMIAMIAHQWKQPLNILSLNMSNLEVMHIFENYEKKELDYIVENSNKTIDYMIKTISDFSEFLKPNKDDSNINIGTIFYQLEPLIQSDIKRNCINFNITYNVDKSENINIHISKFTQVMINIIKNSIDAFKYNYITNAYIKIDISKQKDKFLIQIKDNAGGISKNILKTIFEPYVTTKGKNGTGLGIYMCKLIVEGHLKGEISVKSLNDNTIFDIYLPD